MAVLVDQVVTSLREELAPVGDLRASLELAAEIIGSELGASRVIVFGLRNGSATKAIEWSLMPPDSRHDDTLLALCSQLHRTALRLSHPLIVSDFSLFELERATNEATSVLGIRSALVMSCRTPVGEPWCSLILLRDNGSLPWLPADALVLERAAEELALRAPKTPLGARMRSAAPGHPIGIEPAGGRGSSAVGESLYRRLVENSDAIIFHTDRANVLQFVSRRALDFFGVVPEDFVSGTAVEWFDLIHLDDRAEVRRRALEAQAQSASFEEEFRVINHVTGRERWLLVKFVPINEPAGAVSGWDGFGVDITARRETQEALDTQSKKVRALYTVSSAIRGYLDPANISARGLKALCDATGAEAGLCYLYETPRSKQLALVAHHGFSARFSERVRSTVESNSLLEKVAEKGQSFVVSDITTDPRGKNLVDEDEGLHSAVLVPIAVEEEVFGTLALFHRQSGKFDGGDVMLVAAAANQIGLAARQASLFRAFQKQTKNLSALYRMSHELSHLHTLEEVFQQAFTIIRDELGLKRLWLGMLNETGTRIVGQAAYGPGWRKRLVEMNLELSAADDAIRQVIESRRAVVVHEPETVLGELGLRRFFSRFAIKSLALAPLIARGEVLGILAVQPGNAEPVLEEEELTLLSSLANEIAALILTRRLEGRIAEADKMRSAGLLAAGIAHNFNNLLQAVLGQASLLEMQKANPAQVQRASKIIGEAAAKGATLVRQLLSFANLEEPHPTNVSINQLIEAEMKNWSAGLKSNQHIKLALKAGLPLASVDARHFVRIISTLLSNAVEAMQDKGGPIQLFTEVVTTGSDAAHIEVPEGTYVRIGVRDSGIGMDAETQRRCFEPFFTTKNVDPNSGLSLSGAGLGLAAAYALARKNGGRLVVDSRLGQGSLFTLYLPVKPAAEEPKRRRESRAPSDEGKPA